jgi:hypothetical protein
VDDDHLSAGFIGFHHAMRFVNFVKAENSGRLLDETAGGNVFEEMGQTSDWELHGLDRLVRLFDGPVRESEQAD